MNNRSASVVALGVLMLGDAQAQPAPPTNAPPTAVTLTAEPSVFARPAAPLAPAAPSQNSLVAFGAESQQQMRERLQDPSQRALLRTEKRSDLRQSHAGIGRILDIDAATENALIELLTDQQMEHMDLFHSRFGATPAGGETIIHAEAARQTHRIEQLRELLGESRLEQYQAFEKTSGERSQIRTLDARLDPAHKLTPEQTEQLVPVYQALSARLRDETRSRMSSQPPLGAPLQTMTRLEELQHHMLLQNIEVSENWWRRLPANHRFLSEQAASVLTEPQLATLAQLQSEQANQQQQRIEQLRAQAGLDPKVPALSNAPADAAAPRIERDGDVKVSIRLSIDRKPSTIFSQVVRNGSAATFDAGDGLFVDATPTLYSNGKFDLQIAYYEQSGSGRRLIGETGQAGDIAEQSTQVDLARSGGSGSVLVGRRGYAVEFDTRVEAI